MSRGETHRRFREVLVADDSATIRAAICATLAGAGYVVTEVRDGNAALDRLVSQDSPKLAVIDWEMPGLSGVEVCDLLRGYGIHSTYVVLLTGHDDAVQALDAGANDFVRKPFRSDELLARLRAGERLLSLGASLEERIAELEQAQRNVRELQALLPVCMHCHAVRTEAAHWERIDEYLARHADAQVSHGVCDACMEKHHPGA